MWWEVCTGGVSHAARTEEETIINHQKQILPRNVLGGIWIKLLLFIDCEARPPWRSIVKLMRKAQIRRWWCTNILKHKLELNSKRRKNNYQENREKHSKVVSLKSLEAYKSFWRRLDCDCDLEQSYCRDFSHKKSLVEESMNSVNWFASINWWEEEMAGNVGHQAATIMHLFAFLLWIKYLWHYRYIMSIALPSGVKR